MSFQIAIDGPVAAGKGTISRMLADELRFLYVDTGATYRVATLLAVRNNLDFEKLMLEELQEVSRLVSILKSVDIKMRRPSRQEEDGRLLTLLVEDEDVSWLIREESISSKVAVVSKLQPVREVMVKKQQDIASNNDVVMEGRDITYRVLPQAQLKIYLDAKLEVRIKRRIEQLKSTGQVIDEDQVTRDLEHRDNLDMNRANDPLQIVPDAWYLDGTDLSSQETVAKIVERVMQLRSAI